MATSGTTTYNPTASVIITDALRMIGAIEEGTTASADQITDCLPSFEMMVKGLATEGMSLWSIENYSITPVASQASYDLSSLNETALKITDCVFRNSDGDDIKMTPMSRDEYWNLSDKTSTSSQVNQYYFDPQLGASTLYVWPVPDATAATGTIEIVYQSHFEDVGSSTTDGTKTLDFPQEWAETIKYQLAVRLAPMYGLPLQERYLLNREADALLERSLNWDTEQESIFFRPEKR